MKSKILLTFSIIPFALTSCGSGSLTIEQMKEYIDTIETTDVYPYYRVVGSCIYNNTAIDVDYEFTKDFREKEFIPFMRYHPGAYDPDKDPDGLDESQIMYFNNSSKSYWFRMPMRITKDTFYGTYTDSKGKEQENFTSAYTLLHQFMKSWTGNEVQNANSGNEMVMSINKDSSGDFSGFTFSGVNIHSLIKLDNFPEYPDTSNTEKWPYGVDYDIDGVAPMYKNEVDATFNFLFEYNKDGWLVHEYVASVGFNTRNNVDTQLCAEAYYSYLFE